MRRLTFSAAAAILFTLGACDGRNPALTEPGAPGGPQWAIHDAAHSAAVEGFYFLPPLVPSPTFTGTFDPDRSPVVIICRLSGSVCGNEIVRFNGASGAQGVTVSLTGESYGAVWQSKGSDGTGSLSPSPGAVYRLSVQEGGEELGFADLWVVAKQKDNAPAGYIKVVRGSPLNIKFRIEGVAVPGAPDAVDDPNYATAAATELVVAAPGLLANDDLGDPAATLTHFGGGSLGGAVMDNTAGSPASFGTGGSLQVNADGSFSFTPATGFTGSFTFQYRIANSAGNDVALATITVTAGAVAPVAEDDAFAIEVGEALNGDLLADNGSGADATGSPAATVVSFGGGDLGGTVTSHTTTPPANSVALAGGTLSVTGAGLVSLTGTTQTGSFTFLYRLQNVAGISDAQVTIHIAEGPTAPVAVADGPAANSAPGEVFHAAFNTALNSATHATPTLLANDNPGNPAAVVSSFGGGGLGGTVTSNAAGATATNEGHSVTVNGDGSFVYTPKTGFTGTFGFEYRITNSAGSSDAAVTVAVGARVTASSSSYPTALVANVPINTAGGTPFTVSFTGDAVTLSAGTGTNGAVSLNADGTFTFTPDAGFRSGNGSFQFTASNGFGTTAPATVTIPVGASAMWFVNGAAAPGDGRLGTPFACVVGDSGCLSGAARAAGDVAFIHSGTYGSTAALVLLGNERVIGAGAAGALATLSGLTVPAHSTALLPATGGAKPTLNSAAGNVITLASGNTLRGFVAGGAPGAAIAGATVGTLTIADVDISNGSGRALDLTTSGTLAAAFGSISATGGTGNGINLVNQAGTLTSGSTTITNPSGTGIHVQGSAGFSFGTTTVGKNAAGTGVNLNTNTGTTTFASLAVTTSSGTALLASNAGTVSVSGGALSAAGGPAIDATGTAFGGTGFTSTSSSGSSGRGVALTNVTGTLALGAGSIGTAATESFFVSGGTATISYGGSITNAANRAVSISGRTAGNVTLSGSITETGTGLLVQNVTGGTVTFSGASKSFNTGTNPAVTLTNNGGAAVNFSNGGLAISTTSGAGFVATGGGTVQVTGAANSIVSQTATALRVENTSIGGSGLTFRSISAGTVASGPANGIVLNNTGNANGLQVTGTGTPGSGGTVQRSTGDGIRFVGGVSNVSLSHMVVTTNNGNGIYGDQLTNFTLTSSQVTNNDADHPTGTNEAGLFFNRLYGTNTVRASTIAGTKGDEVRWEANGGAQGTLRVVSSTLGPNPAGEGGNGFAVVAINDATVTAVLDTSTVTGVRTSGFLTAFANTVTTNVMVRHTTFNGNNMGIDHGIGGGNGTFTFTNNTLVNHRSNAFNIISDALSTLTTKADGTIANNTVGNGTGNTGSQLAHGIAVDIRGGAQVAVSITNNLVRNTELRGISIDNRQPDGDIPGARADFIVTGNQAGPPVDVFGGSIEGIFVTSRDSRTTCLHMSGNTATGLNQTGFRLRQANNAVFQLQGLNVTGTDAASVAGFIAGQNTGTASVQTGGTGTVVNYTAANCKTTVF